MTEKLAVILLDALGPGNIRRLDFDFIESQYDKNGDVLGISSLPHTAQSNPLIWSGTHNWDKFWVHSSDDWTDPAQHFDRTKGRPKEDATAFTRDDYDNSFIWDVLDAEGYKATALQVPIVLPPYSFNAEDELEDSWFPDSETRMKEHIRRKPEIIEHHVREGYDFIASSIQMPDKWLHGIAEGKCSQEFMHEEAKVLDDAVKSMVKTMQEHDYDYIYAGDHGSPTPGAMPVHNCQELLPRHRKESVIFSNMAEFPAYTDELYPFMLEYFGVEDQNVNLAQTERDRDMGAEVEERLVNLGYK